MKKTLLTFASMLIFVSPLLKAQNIPNPGFEHWNTIHLPKDPTHFVTSNSQVFLQTGVANVTRSTQQQHGDYAIRLETVLAGGEVVPGLVSSGAVNISGSSFQGGFPFTTAPDSLVGFWKGELQPNDSGFIAFLYINNNQPVSFPVFKYFKGNQSTYTRFSVPIPKPFPGTTDSFFVVMSSGNISSPKVGSVLFLDNLSFIGTTDSIYNQDFEYWTEPSYQDPNDWSSANFITILDGKLSASRTTDKHSGDYAVRIESVYSSVVEDYFGFIATGHIDLSGDFSGGIPTTAKPGKLKGWYKYLPVAGDSAIVGVLFTKYNSTTGKTENVDSAFIKLPPASVYTAFEVPIIYRSGKEHDTVAIVLSSTDISTDTTAREGSILWVDDLEFGQPSPTISFRSITKAIDENDTTITIEVGIDNPNNNPTEVQVVLGTQSTATSGTDFTFTNRQIIFPANFSGAKTVDIMVKEDADNEPDETVVLILRNATNLANLGDSVFTLKIEDDDPIGIKYNGRKVAPLNVRPNPSNEFITITGYTGNGNLVITDITGNVVMEIKANEIQEIDIRNLEPGRYFITAKDSGSEAFRTSFLKVN